MTTQGTMHFAAYYPISANIILSDAITTRATPKLQLCLSQMNSKILWRIWGMILTHNVP